MVVRRHDARGDYAESHDAAAQPPPLALNLAVGIGALTFGIWLEKAPFPLNYQVMFMLAFLFALASLWHCIRVQMQSSAISSSAVPALVSASPRLPNPGEYRAVWGQSLALTRFPAGRLCRRRDPHRLLHARAGDVRCFWSIGWARMKATWRCSRCRTERWGGGVDVRAAHQARKTGTRPMIALAMVGTALAATGHRACAQHSTSR